LVKFFFAKLLHDLLEDAVLAEDDTFLLRVELGAKILDTLSPIP
jgi:hypothetical protein